MVERIVIVFLWSVLAIAVLTDLRTGKIYNRLTLPAMGLGLAFWSAVGVIQDGAIGAGLIPSALAMGVALLPMGLLYAAGGLGGGDVKLMGAVGAISADWRCVLATMVYALVLGGVMAVVVMVRRRIVWRTLRRIAAAALGSLFRVKLPLGDDSPPLPFGVAIGIGGILASAECLLHLRLPWSHLGP